MRAESRRRATHIQCGLAVLALAAGCGQSSDDGILGPTGDGSALAPGADAGSTRDGSGPARDAAGSEAGSTPGVDECNQVEIEFESRVPTVFLLVDRSSSMFERAFWDPLKAGVLTVVESLADEVRFGFTTYTGRQGGTCPELSAISAIAEDNFSAIRSAYDALGAPDYKGETPTALAVAEVAEILAADGSTGPKYILLVTDGEPDFCDDPNVTCARDAVVAAAQAAYAQGVGTFIFSIGGQVDRGHLEDVANAGSGQPVVDRQQAVAQQCSGGDATYSAAGGSAKYFEPNVNDQQALVTSLSSVIAGVRSCVFDLQGRVEIDTSVADMGVVEIDGTRIPYGAPDGFRMNSSTQLELLGASCERLRNRESQRVFIDFPCEAVLLL